MAAVTIHSPHPPSTVHIHHPQNHHPPDFGVQENKVCHCFHCSPHLFAMKWWPDAMIFVFWMLSFKPAFSLSSFTFIKRLFSFTLLSAIRVLSPACLKWLIFLLAVWIRACASSSPAFHMMHSACKLNKHGDNVQYWRVPFLASHSKSLRCLTLPWCLFLEGHRLTQLP